MRATKANVPALSDAYSSPLMQIVPAGKSVHVDRLGDPGASVSREVADVSVAMTLIEGARVPVRPRHEHDDVAAAE